MENSLMCFSDWLINTFNTKTGEPQKGYNYVSLLYKYTDACKEDLCVDDIDFVEWLKYKGQLDGFCDLPTTKINELSAEWLNACAYTHGIDKEVCCYSFGHVSMAIWDMFLMDNSFLDGRVATNVKQETKTKKLVMNFVTFVLHRIQTNSFKCEPLEACLTAYTRHVEESIGGKDLPGFASYLLRNDIEVKDAILDDDYVLLEKVSKEYIWHCKKVADSDVDIGVLGFHKQSDGRVFEDVCKVYELADNRDEVGLGRIVKELFSNKGVDLTVNLRMNKDNTFELTLKGRL